jgi:hypothetical protein
MGVLPVEYKPVVGEVTGSKLEAPLQCSRYLLTCGVSVNQSTEVPALPINS